MTEPDATRIHAQTTIVGGEGSVFIPSVPPLALVFVHFEVSEVDVRSLPLMSVRRFMVGNTDVLMPTDITLAVLQLHRAPDGSIRYGNDGGGVPLPQATTHHRATNRGGPVVVVAYNPTDVPLVVTVQCVDDVPRSPATGLSAPRRVVTSAYVPPDGPRSSSWGDDPLSRGLLVLGGMAVGIKPEALDRDPGRSLVQLARKALGWKEGDDE